MKQFSKGAEATLFISGGTVIKRRDKKSYRHPDLDEALRVSRTRREAKILSKLSSFVYHPILLDSNTKDTIIMSHITGQKLRDVIEGNVGLCKEVGRMVSFMHSQGIIHGDLTTSNMILHDDKVYIIDFGLSFFSDKIEDMAVDLHLLRQALESKHHAISDIGFSMVLEGYIHDKKDDVIARLEKVELRGRNKSKY